jgi:indolepyruvate ferredoxin oxidoreductase beta subunit
VISSSSPYINIPDYPDLDTILEKIQGVKRSVIVDSQELAKQAGFSKSQNMVMLGAASSHLVLKRENLERFIRILFEARGEEVVDINLRAFRLGRVAAVP